MLSLQGPLMYNVTDFKDFRNSLLEAREIIIDQTNLIEIVLIDQTDQS
jgi:hypothetical protein